MPTDAYLQRLKRVEPYAELWRDDKKFVEHRIGLYATLYFDHFHPMVDNNEATREALIECWHDYWNIVGAQHQKWVYRFKSGVHGFRLPTDKVPPIETLLRDPEHFGDYQYHVQGGKHHDDASEYLFDLAGFPVYGAPENPKRLGYLRLQAPLSYVRDQRLGLFVQMVQRCAARLKVDQAHGGLGFLRTYNEENTTRNTEGQLSKVFSGVDVDVPYVQMTDIFRDEQGHLGIDSPHWINCLGERWVNKLGGLEKLRTQLPPDTFVVEPYEGGVFIQAGAAPEPGHRDDGLPPAYIWLNRVLMPVRAPTMVYCMGDEPGQLATHQDAPAYFTRFDAASARLSSAHDGDSTSVNEIVEIDTADQAQRLRCEAGQPCPRTGFWFTPADPDRRRQFQQGKTMPELGSDYGVTVWQWDPKQD